MICTVCGKRLAHSACFCTRCGEPVEAMAIEASHGWKIKAVRPFVAAPAATVAATVDRPQFALVPIRQQQGFTPRLVTPSPARAIAQ